MPFPARGKLTHNPFPFVAWTNLCAQRGKEKLNEQRSTSDVDLKGGMGLLNINTLITHSINSCIANETLWNKCRHPHFNKIAEHIPWCSWEACCFLKGNGRGGSGAEGKGGAGGWGVEWGSDWEEWREGSLWSGCIVWENVCMWLCISEHRKWLIFFFSS